MTTSVATYVEAKNQVLSATNGVDYAYRSAGGASDAIPLVTLQHFRGNLDNWDPALVDALARGRRVITFDNRGVAASSGTTPPTIAQMALDAIDFIDALDVGEVDLLGFSIGSFVAQEIALVRPSIVRKVVLASSAPKGAGGMHGWAADVIAAVGEPETSPEGYLSVFFTRLRGRPCCGPGGRRPHLRGTHRRPRRADHLADPARAIRRRLRMGTAEPLAARARLGDRQARVRGQRRQRPHDPPALLLPAGGPHPRRASQALPGRRARLPLPTPRRVRRGRRRVPGRRMTSGYERVLG